MKIACIIPSRNRPAQLRRCVDQFFATLRQGNDVMCIVVLNGNVEKSYMAMQGSKAVIAFNESDKGTVSSWNLGLQCASDYDAFIAGADDLTWHKGWLEAALAALATLPNPQVGMVGFNDLDRTDEMATHFIATRQCIKTVFGGVLAIPAYHHYWTDPEMNARARRAGCYVWCKDAIVEHRSAMNHKAPNDQTYLDALHWFAEDEAMFHKREAAHFPDDFEPVLI